MAKRRTPYRYLEARPRSNYRQLWVKGRHMRAEVLYRHTVGSEPRTPQEVADDYGLPVEAVMEAIDYAARNSKLLDEERRREETRWCEVSSASRGNDKAASDNEPQV